MSTPIIQTLIPNLRQTVQEHILAYLEKGGELSSIHDSLEFWYDRYRDTMAPELPMWQDLPTPDKDQLFDAWIAAMEDFFRQRLTKSDPVVTLSSDRIPAPVTFEIWWDANKGGIAPEPYFYALNGFRAGQMSVSSPSGASLSPEAAYAFLKEENTVLRSQIENHDVTLEQVRVSHRSQVSLLREKLKDCEQALERAEKATATSSTSLLVRAFAEPLNASQGGSVFEVEPLGEVNGNGQIVEFQDAGKDSCILTVAWYGVDLFMDGSNGSVSLKREQVPSLIAHLHAWLDTGSFALRESAVDGRDELIREAAEALEGLLDGTRPNYDDSIFTTQRKRVNSGWKILTKLQSALG